MWTTGATSAQESISLRPAELVIDEQGLLQPNQPGEQSFVRLHYYFPGATGGAYSLTSDRFTVDGNPANTVRLNNTELIQITTRCGDSLTAEPQLDTCGFVHELPPGVHTVVATTTIVGQVTQPEPVTLQVELKCPESGDAPPHAVTDTGTPIEGLPGTTETSATTPEGGAGCALSAAQRSAAPGTALLTLLFGLAQMRRRRR
jgi:hypothetical protein